MGLGSFGMSTVGCASIHASDPSVPQTPKSSGEGCLDALECQSARQLANVG